MVWSCCDDLTRRAHCTLGYTPASDLVTRDALDQRPSGVVPSPRVAGMDVGSHHRMCGSKGRPNWSGTILHDRFNGSYLSCASDGWRPIILVPQTELESAPRPDCRVDPQ
ncbi:hypothetical protein Q4I28_007358 [Leishmania naiffi]|uniref:Uncharacterized protein n=1 Tax=Leishmania naiffi TaxID=5678 RepID=A0AAW3B8E7_9TRYP